MFPHARRDRLLVREMGDEIVVYDLERHRAHCLTRTAASIWRLCDGQKTVAELAQAVEQELHVQVDEEVVWLVLNRLERAHLLQDLLLRPREIAGVSRRQAISLGLAGAASLLLQGCGVDSITAPTPVATQEATNAGPSGAQLTSQQLQPSPPPPSPSPPPRPRCGPLSGTICDEKRGELTKARCQTRCDPGTPECRRVAPKDICEGRYTERTFTMVVGSKRLFCRHCACICGEFKPGKPRF